MVHNPFQRRRELQIFMDCITLIFPWMGLQRMLNKQTFVQKRCQVVGNGNIFSTIYHSQNSTKIDRDLQVCFLYFFVKITRKDVESGIFSLISKMENVFVTEFRFQVVDNPNVDTVTILEILLSKLPLPLTCEIYWESLFTNGLKKRIEVSHRLTLYLHLYDP